MPKITKFPTSVEIKRAIAATIKAGIDIGMVDIYADRITIHTRRIGDPKLSDYDMWKLSEGKNSALIRHSDPQSDARRGKSRG